MLASKSEANVKAFDGWHQTMEWMLLVFIGVHVATALVHLFGYRDRIMHRMLPG
jgi:cytochrome b561